jgi:hypothetical protein
MLMTVKVLASIGSFRLYCTTVRVSQVRDAISDSDSFSDLIDSVEVLAPVSL